MKGIRVVIFLFIYFTSNVFINTFDGSTYYVRHSETNNWSTLLVFCPSFCVASKVTYSNMLPLRRLEDEPTPAQSWTIIYFRVPKISTSTIWKFSFDLSDSSFWMIALYSSLSGNGMWQFENMSPWVISLELLISSGAEIIHLTWGKVMAIKKNFRIVVAGNYVIGLSIFYLVSDEAIPTTFILYLTLASSTFDVERSVFKLLHLKFRIDLHNTLKLGLQVRSPEFRICFEFPEGFEKLVRPDLIFDH